MNKKENPNRSAALRIIYDRGLIRGRDLKRFANIDTAEVLMEIINSLARDRFIALERGAYGVDSPEAALNASIASVPSRKAEVEYTLSSSSSSEAG